MLCHLKLQLQKFVSFVDIPNCLIPMICAEQSNNIVCIMSNSHFPEKCYSIWSVPVIYIYIHLYMLIIPFMIKMNDREL